MNSISADNRIPHLEETITALDQDLKLSRLAVDKNIACLTFNVETLTTKMDGMVTNLDRVATEMVRSNEQNKFMMERITRLEVDQKELRGKQQISEVELARLSGVENTNTVKVDEREKAIYQTNSRYQPWIIFVAGIGATLFTSGIGYMIYMVLQHWVK